MTASLAQYRKKRNFSRTPEPAGEPKRKPHARALCFVVQKHAARRLHYDFRLELDGVMKSWAVPKGPSLAAGARRLAVEVEDHPLEYATFEGVIPPGEYGGGAVLVWDNGSWRPIGDPREGLEKGKLDFELEGGKLRGRFHLVRTRSADRKKANWLLIKGRDAQARDEKVGEITETAPESVLTERTIEQVASDADRVWSSRRGEIRRGKGRAARTRRAGKNRKPRAVPAVVAPAKERAADAAGLIAGVRLSTPSRVYYPELGLTKLELARYYESVAEWMLPGLAFRPLTLLRCPEGHTGHCFFQKRARDLIPKNVPRVVVRSGREPYAMVSDLGTLIELVQLGVLEFHVWGARADRLERPDILVFDLDPDPTLPWKRVVWITKMLRALLEELSLVPFLRATGGKGLHVVVPLVRRSSWDELKTFSHAVALALVRVEPEQLTAVMTKRRRQGKIFIDYLRNAPEATAIASYSTRARPGAPVALPLFWEELDELGGPLEVSVRDVREWVGRGDPWQDFEKSRKSLSGAVRRLDEMTA